MPSDLPCIRLYDLRKFDAGAFATQPVHDPSYNYPAGGPPPVTPPFSGAKFSPDGAKLLITTASDVHYVVDSFQPSTTFCKLGAGTSSFAQGGANLNDVWFGSEADFAPDSCHVLSGSAVEGGTVSVYACDAPPGAAPLGRIVAVLDYVAPTPVHRVAFNHRYNMFVTTSQTGLVCHFTNQSFVAILILRKSNVFLSELSCSVSGFPSLDFFFTVPMQPFTNIPMGV
jgi:COMPASS component SWD2